MPSPIFDLHEIRRRVLAGQYELKLHAQKRIAARKITLKEVETVLLNGDIIEEYPDASPLPKCLMMGYVRGGVPLYVSVAIGNARLFIVTVHWFDPDKWIDHRTRRR
ncbi:MAG: DUF4258 domain-containing protein [Armatimonadetes bacterium]|nr:DUF4258 domain-containing protein [Armatimonadota bacterium]